MHTVFNASYEPIGYLDWQAQLLTHTYYKVKQKGRLTCLLATDGPTWNISGLEVITHKLAHTLIDGDNYPVFNRIVGLQYWLNNYDIQDSTILIIDPDCLYLKHMPEQIAERGNPIRQYISYIDPAKNYDVLVRYCDPSVLQPMGTPSIIHIDDLKLIIQRWLDWTIILRKDKDVMADKYFAWCADMWGYMIAAAEIGLHHEYQSIIWQGTDDKGDEPILHYTFPGNMFVSGWSWDKRSYKPWEPIRFIPDETPEPLYKGLEILNDFSTMQRVRHMVASK